MYSPLWFRTTRPGVKVTYLLSLTCRRSSRHPHHSISRNFQWNFGALFLNSRRNVALLYSISIAHSFTVEQFTISPFLSPALSSSARLVTDDFSSLRLFPLSGLQSLFRGRAPHVRHPTSYQHSLFFHYITFSKTRELDEWKNSTDRQTDWQTDRQINRQTDRQTDR